MPLRIKIESDTGGEGKTTMVILLTRLLIDLGNKVKIVPNVTPEIDPEYMDNIVKMVESDFENGLRMFKSQPITIIEVEPDYTKVTPEENDNGT